MSEPELGSDVAAIRTRAVRNADGGYTIDGQKMWLTNGGSSTLVAALVKTDEGATKPHRNLTAFLIEKPTGFGTVAPGLVIPGKIDKLGYKGIDTTELIFDGYNASAYDVLGGTPGQGFFQMMDGIEVGRVNGRPELAGWESGHSSSPCVMRSNAARSASRSPNTRPSRFSSRRWRPRWRPPTP